MREAGKNGELGSRPSRAIQACVLLAPAKEPEKLDHVGGTNRIGIRENDQRRALRVATFFDES